MQHTQSNGNGGAMTVGKAQEDINKAIKAPETASLALNTPSVRRNIEAAIKGAATFDEFLAVCMRAVAKTPGIVSDIRTFLTAAIDCATDGLVPDGREAAFVPYKGKIQYQPMVWGLCKLARQSGEVQSISARIVYERDIFTYELGDDERITHRPYMGPDGTGPVTHVYAIARMTNGGVEREVMPLWQIDSIQARSASAKSGEGPWATDWEEMAKKTVLRKLMKRLPRSKRLGAALERLDASDSDQHDIAVPLSVAQPAHASLPAKSNAERFTDALNGDEEAPPPKPAHAETVRRREPETAPAPARQESKPTLRAVQGDQRRSVPTGYSGDAPPRTRKPSEMDEPPDGVDLPELMEGE